MHITTPDGLETITIRNDDPPVTYGNPSAILETDTLWDTPADYLEAADELQKASTAFHQGDKTLEPAIQARPLSELLEQSGSSIAGQSETFPSSAGPSTSRQTSQDSATHASTKDSSTSEPSTDPTQSYDNSLKQLRVIGETLCYPENHLSSLTPQQRETLTTQLTARHKALHPKVTDFVAMQKQLLRNQRHPAADDADSPAEKEFDSQYVHDMLTVCNELLEARRQILFMLDLDIAVDRHELALKKAASSTTQPQSQYQPQYRDPTLPQNRPSQFFRPPTPPPLPIHLTYLATLEEVDQESERRGGPGRLSLEEFEEIMKSEGGRKLGFVGAWIEMASF